MDLDVHGLGPHIFRLAQARASNKFGQAAALILHIYFTLDQIGS
jgi:hypothetical protein